MTREKYSVADLPLQFGQPILKNLATAMASGVFAAIGILMLLNGEKVGWLVAGFFGLGAVLLLMNVIPSSGSLELNEGGFVFGSGFRRSLVRWDCVSGFRILGGRQPLVGFDYADTASHDLSKKLAKQLSGSQGALPSCYGFTPEELVQLLEETQTSVLRDK